MADDAWYYAQNNQQLGPVTLEALRTMAASGQIAPDNLVWTQGMAQWLPARTVPEVGNALVNVAAPTHAGFQQAPSAYAPAAAPLGYGGYQSYAGGQPVEYAGFWLRFCAAFLDGLIIGIPFFILGFVGEMLFPGSTNPRTGMQTPSGAGLAFSGVVQILQILAYWLYFAFQESGEHQATIGKRAVGIKVTGLNGERISFANATGRHFAKILSGCILYIGFIMAAFTERKQGLHDQLASTLVVKK
jgi:uncharacterized RDD family membrane protein YckC